MGFLIRLFLWLAGVYLIIVIAKGLQIGIGFLTQFVIGLWICTIYLDARYHEFGFIE